MNQPVHISSGSSIEHMGAVCCAWCACAWIWAEYRRSSGYRCVSLPSLLSKVNAPRKFTPLCCLVCSSPVTADRVWLVQGSGRVGTCSDGLWPIDRCWLAASWIRFAVTHGAAFTGRLTRKAVVTTCMESDWDARVAIIIDWSIALLVCFDLCVLLYVSVIPPSSSSGAHLETCTNNVFIFRWQVWQPCVWIGLLVKRSSE